MPETYRGIYTVPSSSDAPDVPLAFKQFANNQWHQVSGSAAQDWGGRNVNTGEGAVELVGLDLASWWPTYTLMFISTSMVVGTFGNSVIGYYWIEGDGGVIGPEYVITGAPAGQTFSNNCIRVKQTAPGGRISLKVRMDVSIAAFSYKQINVQALYRG